MNNFQLYVHNTYEVITNPWSYEAMANYLENDCLPSCTIKLMLDSYVMASVLRYQDAGIAQSDWINSYNDVQRAHNQFTFKLLPLTIWDRLFRLRRVEAQNKIRRMITIHEANLNVLHKMRWSL